MPDVPGERKAGYAVLLVAYSGLAGMLTLLVRRRTRGRVPSVKPTDVMLLGLATFKLSRVVAKDKVMTPVREPFVEETEPGEGSEVNSKPARRGGLRSAVGELITCPFCISVWIATLLVALFSLAPRAVRLAASGLGAMVLADSGQYVYSRLRESS